MMNEDVAKRGLVLLGCGKMGSAMLQGWLSEGLPTQSVWVVDPKASDWLRGLDGLNLNATLPKDPAIVILAVKPQMMQAALPVLRPMGNGGSLFLSVAAGISISALLAVLGDKTPIIRAMPNTPAAVGKGITALIGSAQSKAAHMELAQSLLAAVGQTVLLDNEDQMDAVTAVSGSGPAYVFHLIETLADAGVRQGLPSGLSMRLAKATVAGAGALAEEASDDPTQLRINVTSPAGTTAAALEVLMDAQAGFPPLLHKAVAAAADRSRELGS